MGKWSVSATKHVKDSQCRCIRSCSLCSNAFTLSVQETVLEDFEDNFDSLVTNTTFLRWERPFGPVVSNRTIVGFTVSHEYFYNTETDVNLGVTNVYKPVGVPPLLGRTAPGHNVELDNDQLGVFISDEVTLYKRLHLLAAGRWSSISTSLRFPRAGSASTDSDNDQWNPTFGIVGDVPPNVSTYFSYAKGWKRAASRRWARSTPGSSWDRWNPSNTNSG